MASISFDSSNGFWSVRYLSAPGVRSKKTLARHPGTWSKDRPPKRVPPEIKRLAAPYEAAERSVRAFRTAHRPDKETPLESHLLGYAAQAAPGHAKLTQRWVKAAANRFLAYCTARKVTTLGAVTPALCRDWVASRFAEGAKASTIRVERAYLRPAWARAVADGLIPSNPWDSAPVPGRERKEVPTAWTREEVDTLLAATSGWLRDVMVVGLNTGIRITALLGLKWSQVDWGAGLIRVTAASSKSGRPYEVPITSAAHDVLFRRQAVDPTGTGYIFLNPKTGKPYAHAATYQRIGRLVKATGVTDYGDHCHILRRTFATLALNSGVPLEVVSRCLGHATLAQTQQSYASILAHRLIEGMTGFEVGGGPRD